MNTLKYIHFKGRLWKIVKNNKDYYIEIKLVNEQRKNKPKVEVIKDG